MKLVDCSYEAVKAIISEIDNHHLILSPSDEISLKKLEELSGCRVQSIGMAFDKYIQPALLKRGIDAIKSGNPVILKLTIKK